MHHSLNKTPTPLRTLNVFRLDDGKRHEYQRIIGVHRPPPELWSFLPQLLGGEHTLMTYQVTWAGITSFPVIPKTIFYTPSLVP
jgi:hypothetical protein